MNIKQSWPILISGNECWSILYVGQIRQTITCFSQPSPPISMLKALCGRCLWELVDGSFSTTLRWAEGGGSIFRERCCCCWCKKLPVSFICPMYSIGYYSFWSVLIIVDQYWFTKDLVQLGTVVPTARFLGLNCKNFIDGTRMVKTSRT